MVPPRPIKPHARRWTTRVVQRLHRIAPDEALNLPDAAVDPPHTAANTSLAVDLRRTVTRLENESVDPASGRVDYAAVQHSATFADYCERARALIDFNPTTLPTEAEQRAFWINLYNALIVHGVIVHHVQGRITEVRGAFDRFAYVVNRLRFSANDIEHGILRANAGHPARPGSQFAAADPRRDLCLPLDPRIHFALNCAARSCPPIHFYSPDDLDAQLSRAAAHFAASGGITLDAARRTVHLSRIFSWYAGDFGGAWFGYRRRPALLRHVAPYHPDEAVRDHLLADATRLRVIFQPYDWTLHT